MLPIIKLSSRETKEYWEIPVLFEDEHVLALDKPSRLLTSPDRYDPDRPNLMKLLHRDIARSAPWSQERGLSYLANVHRLDFETSGVILMAKNKPALIALANHFSAGRATKGYIAFVRGVPAEPKFEVDAPLGHHPLKPQLMRVDLKLGKQSLTRFELVEAFRRMSLIRCSPVTGRTHQIRAHLRWARMPILGDTLYGGRLLFLSSLKPDYRQKKSREERPLLGRVALHADRLTVPHPVTGVEMTIEAPWPKDMTVALKYLRKYASVGAGDQLHQADEDEHSGDQEAESGEMGDAQ